MFFFSFNLIRTGVFGKRVSLGGSPPGFIALFVNLEFSNLVHHKNNVELSMTNCDVSMMSYSNFVADNLKIRPFSVLVRILVQLS